MIQDTTLRMVVQAVDQASAPLDAVKDKVDGLSNSIDGTKAAAEDALPAVGKAATDVVDDFDDLGQSASRAASFMGPAMVEAAVVAGVALLSLAKYLREVAAEHEKIRDTAMTLSLPYETVKNYSEAWLDVANALSEAARGYRELSEAQQAALAKVGLDPGNLREADRTKTLIALGKGTDLEKVDALRRLFGLNDEKAIAIIKDENRKFFREMSASGILGLDEAAFKRILAGDTRGVSPEIAQRVRDYTNPAGVGFGQLDVSTLTSRLPTPNQSKDLRADQSAAEAAIRDINASVEREKDKARRTSEQADRQAAREALERTREQYDRQQDFVEQGLKIREQEEKALAATIKENDKQIEQAGKDAWSNVNDETRARLKEMEVPVNEFVETWKDAMKDMVFFGDFSFKRLVARIIVQLTSKELFAAIDRVGDALADAMSGGGGLVGGIKSFFGSIFGNAGGGQESGLRWVGEEGPELVASGPNAMRVYNMRQLAFAGGGGSQQSVKYYDNRTYSISGVDTQQVVAYIEQTRRDDQRGMVRMLERNGLGSMR